MDFCIADNIEELENNNDFSYLPFFSKNLVNLINFPIFEEQCFANFQYGEFGFQNIGIFTLQPKGKVQFFYPLIEYKADDLFIK